MPGPGPLDINAVIGEVRTELLNMEFDVDVFDEHGVKTGTERKKVVDGNGIEQMATAMGTAIFNILKNQVLVNVQTTTPVPSTPGVFVGNGTGTVE